MLVIFKENRQTSHLPANHQQSSAIWSRAVHSQQPRAQSQHSPVYLWYRHYLPHRKRHRYFATFLDMSNEESLKPYVHTGCFPPPYSFRWAMYGLYRTKYAIPSQSDGSFSSLEMFLQWCWKFALLARKAEYFHLQPWSIISWTKLRYQELIFYCHLPQPSSLEGYFRDGGMLGRGQRNSCHPEHGQLFHVRALISSASSSDPTVWSNRETQYTSPGQIEYQPTAILRIEAKWWTRTCKRLVLSVSCVRLW